MKELLIIIVIAVIGYYIYYNCECRKYGCKPSLKEAFQFGNPFGNMTSAGNPFLGTQFAGAQAMTAAASAGQGWIYVGTLYSQKTDDKLLLEKNVNPLLGNVMNYRGIDLEKQIIVPVDTNNRPLRNNQLISIQGYEDRNPWLVEIEKTMEFQHNPLAY